MSDEIPQWAWQQVDNEVGPFTANSNSEWAAMVDRVRAVAARLYAKHEPETRLLLEARQLIAETYSGDINSACGDGPARARQIRDGRGDDYWETRAVLAALRRGIELAKVQR